MKLSKNSWSYNPFPLDRKVKSYIAIWLITFVVLTQLSPARIQAAPIFQTDKTVEESKADQKPSSTPQPEHEKSNMKPVLQPAPQKDADANNEQSVYVCPMHPEVTSNKPGKCPKCEMTLVKKAAATQEHDHSKMQQPVTPPKGQAPAKSDEHAGHQMQPDKALTKTSQPTGPAITLTELEQMAMKNNPTFAQAEAAIRAAEGRRVQAGLFPNPVVGYRGEEFAFRSFSNKSEHFFFVEQEIPLGGKLKKSRRIFEQEQTQSLAEAEAQRLRVMNTIRMLYYEALGAQQLVDIRTELAKLTNEAVSVTEELKNIGQADQPDQLDIDVEAQKADLALVQVENERAQIWQTLTAVVGNPSLQPVRLAGDLEKGLPTIDGEAMLRMLLDQSPEMKIARAKVDRAKAALDRAKAERTPDMIIRGGLGYSTERLELGTAPFPRRTGPEASIEIGFRLPIFNRNQGNISSAEADLASSDAEVRRVELSLRARFSSTLTNYNNAARTVARYQEAILPRAKKSYELYAANFAQMAAAYPQVLIAKRSLYQTQADYVNALVKLWQNGVHIQGYLLTGGLDAPANSNGETGVEAGQAPGIKSGSQSRNPNEENDH